MTERSLEFTGAVVTGPAAVAAAAAAAAAFRAASARAMESSRACSRTRLSVLMRDGVGRDEDLREQPAATTETATAIPKTRAIESIFLLPCELGILRAH